MVVYWAENGMEDIRKHLVLIMNPHIDNEEQLQRIFDSLKKSRYVDVDCIIQCICKKYDTSYRSSGSYEF